MKQCRYRCAAGCNFDLCVDCFNERQDRVEKEAEAAAKGGVEEAKQDAPPDGFDPADWQVPGDPDVVNKPIHTFAPGGRIFAGIARGYFAEVAPPPPAAAIAVAAPADNRAGQAARSKGQSPWLLSWCCSCTHAESHSLQKDAAAGLEEEELVVVAGGGGGEACQDNFRLEDFRTQRMLSARGSAQERLVRHGPSGAGYVLKSWRKPDCLTGQTRALAARERAALGALDGIFVVRLVRTFQDSARIYLLLEFCPGGALSEHLQAFGPLDVERALFYCGNLLLALEHLHGLQYLYRTLSSANCLLAADGYLKLTDLGWCKQATSASTVCGALPYRAPEMMQGREYTASADWWSLGVLAFEMLVGATPFADSEPLRLRQKVTRGSFRAPDALGTDARAFVAGLLQGNPSQRWGSQRCRSSAFFAGLSLDDLAAKRLPAPRGPPPPSAKGADVDGGAEAEDEDDGPPRAPEDRGAEEGFLFEGW